MVTVERIGPTPPAGHRLDDVLSQFVVVHVGEPVDRVGVGRWPRDAVTPQRVLHGAVPRTQLVGDAGGAAAGGELLEQPAAVTKASVAGGRGARGIGTLRRIPWSVSWRRIR